MFHDSGKKWFNRSMQWNTIVNCSYKSSVIYDINKKCETSTFRFWFSQKLRNACMINLYLSCIFFVTSIKVVWNEEKGQEFQIFEE